MIDVRWCCVLVLMCLVAPAHADDDHVVASARVRVSGIASLRVITEAHTIGEALYDALAEHFGATPPRRLLPLELKIHATRSSFETAVRRAGVRASLVGIGGYTTAAGPSHVAIQTEPFDTRRLVIHELTHAFQDRVTPHADARPVPSWYREGLAEWYGWHRRTAEGIRFGALDAVAYRQRPAMAAKRVDQGRSRTMSAVWSGGPADYTDALATVAGLMSARGEIRVAFTAFEKDLIRRGAGQAKFPAEMTGLVDLHEAMRALWGAFELPWIARTLGFDEVPGGFTGRSAAGGLARLEAAKRGRGIELTLDGLRLGESGEAGVQLGTDARAIRVTVTKAGTLQLVQSGAVVGTWPLPGAEGPVRLRLARDGTDDVLGIQVERGGKSRRIGVGRDALDVDGAPPTGVISLVAMDGEARFSRVRLR